MKSISEIDFGPKDARHSYSIGGSEEQVFSKVFVDPMGINLDDFRKGKRSFIYGIKGSGKSALLRNLEYSLRSKEITKFIYFSQIVEETYDKNMEIGLDIRELEGQSSFRLFWRSLIFILIAKSLYEQGKGSFKKYLEFVRRQSTESPGNLFGAIFGSAPTLESWTADIGSASGVKLDGAFAKVVNLSHFFDCAVSLLKTSKIEKSVWIFIDELEVIYKSKDQFSRDVEAATDLVKTVRDLNEEFRANKIPVYLVCAIRKEITDRIVGKDAAKIVSDLGEEVSWQRSSWENEDPNFIHPLFRIVSRRLYYSNYPNRNIMSHQDTDDMLRKYFPFFYKGQGTLLRRNAQSKLLDLTTYRPRDISILFGEARKIDKGRSSFRAETFQRLVRKPLRDSLWLDFTEALRARFSEEQVDLLGKVFFRLKRRFQFAEFLDELDGFSHDPQYASIMDEFGPEEWADILRELYLFGAVGNIERGENIEERLLFYFRGDTDGLIINKNTDIYKQEAMHQV